MNPDKKISFGFNKLSKKLLTISRPLEKKVDYVVSLEGQSIKLKNQPKEVEKAPLVIPLKDNQKDLLDRVKEMKAKQKNNVKTENEEVEDTRPDAELTIEELAAREVIREAKLRLSQTDMKSNKIVVVPMKKEDELPLDGEKESTLHDYENVPVDDFGLAMLRGMGWKEGTGIGKNPTKTATSTTPELRPKGLGLGASAIVNSETQKQPACDKDGKTLILKTGSYAKIIAGSYKGNYCEVQGFDDEAGRVVVKTSLKGDILTLNEFMLVPVTKEDYSRNSKVINTAKFEEYKEMEERKIKVEIKSEKNDKHSTQPPDKYKKENTKIKKEHRSTSEDSDKQQKRYSKGKSEVKSEKADYSSDETHSKSSKKRDKDKSDKYSKKHDDSSDSASDNERSRRIHKRKDKRSHRDKSRSPYRTKHKSSRKSSKSKHRYRSSSDSESERKSKSKSRKNDDNDDDKHRRRSKR